jgi:hypothetical protein
MQTLLACTQTQSEKFLKIVLFYFSIQQRRRQFLSSVAPRTFFRWNRPKELFSFGSSTYNVLPERQIEDSALFEKDNQWRKAVAEKRFCFLLF